MSVPPNPARMQQTPAGMHSLPPSLSRETPMLSKTSTGTNPLTHGASQAAYSGRVRVGVRGWKQSRDHRILCFLRGPWRRSCGPPETFIPTGMVPAPYTLQDSMLKGKVNLSLCVITLHFIWRYSSSHSFCVCILKALSVARLHTVCS
jgi:hypothetical protein